MPQALEEASKELHLIPHPDFIHKCIQLYDTITVRHGIMLVGEAMSGKTSYILLCFTLQNIVDSN